MTHTEELAAGSITTQVFTSPHPTPDLDPLPPIVSYLGAGKVDLFASWYSCTSVEIADAVIAMFQRNVPCMVVMDATEYVALNSQGPRVFAVLGGGSFRIRGNSWMLNHDKCLVIDGLTKNAVVINGSYNYTTQAETENVECCEIKTGIAVSRVMGPTYINQIKADFALATPPPAPVAS